MTLEEIRATYAAHMRSPATAYLWRPLMAMIGFLLAYIDRLERPAVPPMTIPPLTGNAPDDEAA